MKKSFISMALVGCLLLSSHTHVLGGFSFKGRLGASIEKIKTTYNAYKECRIKKNCTRKQKLAFYLALGALLTVLLVGAAFIAKKTYESRQLVPGLKRFIDDVRKNLHSEALGAVTYDISLLRGPYAKKRIDDAERALKDLMRDIVKATQQGLPVDVYYDGLKATYEGNFAKLTQLFAIQYNLVYEFLGTSQEMGRHMSLSQVKDLIKSKSDTLRKQNYDAEKVASLVRQLDYIFRSEGQKKEYDAFLQGKQALRALYKESNSRVREYRTKVLVEIIPAIMLRLDALK